MSDSNIPDLTEDVIDEIRRRLGLESVEEEFADDEIISDEPDEETLDDGSNDDISGEDAALSYPWPITVTTATRAATDGSVRVDATLQFDEVPGATNYEIRIVPV